MPSYNLVKGTTYSTGMTVTAANLNAHVDVAKIVFTASDILVGRASSGSGDWEDVTCTAAGRAMIAALSAAAQKTLLGLGPADSPTFTNVTLTGSLIASSFSGAFNGTVGATTPSTGQFTTGGFSGQQNNGIAGTGTNTAGITLAGGSGVAGGGLVAFTRNSANPIYIGNAAPVLGGASNDGLFYAGPGQSILFHADGAQKGVLNSSGLNVTSVLTVTQNNPKIILTGPGNADASVAFQASNSQYNWKIATVTNVVNALEFIPSTTPGGTTYGAPTMYMTPGVVAVNGSVGVMAGGALRLYDSASSDYGYIFNAGSSSATQNFVYYAAGSGPVAHTFRTFSGGVVDALKIAPNGAVTLANGLAVTGSIFGTGADNTVMMRLSGTTGRLRFTNWANATDGGLIDSTNVAESVYLPLSIRGSSVLIYQNATISATFSSTGFALSGDQAQTGAYHNFSFLQGVTGFGFRSNGGTMEFKNNGGSWNPIAGGGGSGTVTSVGVSGANGIGVSGSPITSSGTISLSLGAITPSSVNVSGVYSVGGTQVVGPRAGTITNMSITTSGFTSSDAATLTANFNTIQSLVNTLLNTLRTHGLFS